jgi:hypothetical protein
MSAVRTTFFLPAAALMAQPTPTEPVNDTILMSGWVLKMEASSGSVGSTEKAPSGSDVLASISPMIVAPGSVRIRGRIGWLHHTDWGSIGRLQDKGAACSNGRANFVCLQTKSAESCSIDIPRG